MLRQMIFASMSLEYFKPGADKDTSAIAKGIAERIQPGVVGSENSQREANFGHLMGYGSGYYGYMWSKVFALDVFDNIRSGKGLLSSEYGTLSMLLARAVAVTPMSS